MGPVAAGNLFRQRGPGGWASGRGLRNTDLFANLHPALNGQGPGGGRVMKLASPLEVEVMEVWFWRPRWWCAGLTYGDDLISALVGGSGGGHAIRGSGNAGGGGGALSLIAGGSFVLEQNASITVNGGTGIAL